MKGYRCGRRDCTPACYARMFLGRMFLGLGTCGGLTWITHQAPAKSDNPVDKLPRERDKPSVDISARLGLLCSAGAERGSCQRARPQPHMAGNLPRKGGRNGTEAPAKFSRRGGHEAINYTRQARRGEARLITKRASARRHRTGSAQDARNLLGPHGRRARCGSYFGG